MAILGILSFGYARDSMAVRAAVLRQAGYRVEEAHSPAQCLESIKSDAIDVVLLCHSVPKAEAQLLVSLIREQRVLLPILCVSSSDHAAAPEGCIRASNAPIPLVNSLRNAIRKPPTPPGAP